MSAWEDNRTTVLRLLLDMDHSLTTQQVAEHTGLTIQEARSALASYAGREIDQGRGAGGTTTWSASFIARRQA